MRSSGNAGETPHEPIGSGPLEVEYDGFQEFLPRSNWNDSATLTKRCGTNVNVKDDGSQKNASPKHGKLLGTAVPTNSRQPISAQRNEVTQNETAADEIEIPQDSFSMFYVATTFQDMLPPFMVFAVQVSTLSLIFYDLKYAINSSLIDLPMNIPADVSIAVNMAQFLACIISVFTAEDFIDGLFFVGRPILLRDGIRTIKKDLSLKWEVSNLMRMTEGALVIAVSFVFIVQATTVIDLFLNFAGVAFVSQLDDAYFRLAQRDLFGARASKLADQVSQSKVHTSDKKTRAIVRFSVFAGLIIGMISGLAVIATRQDKPEYGCKSVSLTVGEARFPSYRRLSGTYILEDQIKPGRRSLYVQKQGDGAYIGYCKADKRWTVTSFSWIDGDDDGDDHYDDYVYKLWDPCPEYRLQSERTRTYDIAEVNQLQYYTGEATDGEIKCNECSMKKSEESCGWQGSCNVIDGLKTCECYEGYFGHSCQFDGPCTELVFQEDEFPGYGKRFQLMYHRGSKEPLMVHDRPAYIQRSTSSLTPLLFVLILFDGGRWLVIESDEGLHNWDPAEQEIEEYLAEDFNAMTHDYTSEYISVELSYGGMPLVPFRPHLTSEESDWSTGKLGEKEFTLLCADCWNGTRGVSNCIGTEGSGDLTICKPKTISLYDNKQVEANRCDCTHGFIGPLCQTRPVEGKILYHLEHGDPNACSSCGENNMWNVWDLWGVDGKTCLPFPREPLVFKGANGTIVSRQIGLHLNETHFSVFVSNHGRYFPKGNNTGTKELICSVQEGSKEIRSIKRSDVPKDQTDIDFAVLLNTSKDFFGEVVDPWDIECLTRASVDENACDGSDNGTLSEVYQESHLTRAWIQLNLKITQ